MTRLDTLQKALELAQLRVLQIKKDIQTEVISQIRVRAERSSLGDVANLLGYSKPYLSDIWQGKRGISPEFLKRWKEL